MTKKLSVMILALVLGVSALYAGKGKVRIASDKEGAYIYVDGKKKAMTGEGFTSILLEEGEWTVKVVKPIDENTEYSQSKKVFIGEDSSVKLSFKLKKEMTARGKATEAQRWKRSGNVVIDNKLRLMWQDNAVVKSVRKQWLSNSKYKLCKAKKSFSTCHDTRGDTAATYCSNLTLGGYDDWRLPSKDELISIIDKSRKNPAIKSIFRHTGMDDSYSCWSSTTYEVLIGAAWSVMFTDGLVFGSSGKVNAGYVRCVRDSQ